MLSMNFCDRLDAACIASRAIGGGINGVQLYIVPIESCLRNQIFIQIYQVTFCVQGVKCFACISIL